MLKCSTRVYSSVLHLLVNYFQKPGGFWPSKQCQSVWLSPDESGTVSIFTYTVTNVPRTLKLGIVFVLFIVSFGFSFSPSLHCQEPCEKCSQGSVSTLCASCCCLYLYAVKCLRLMDVCTCTCVAPQMLR